MFLIAVLALPDYVGCSPENLFVDSDFLMLKMTRDNLMFFTIEFHLPFSYSVLCYGGCAGDFPGLV